MGKLADPIAVTGTSEFRVEATYADRRIQGVHESLLQEAEKDIIWYREHFFGKAHHNFLALETEKGPLAISLIYQSGHAASPHASTVAATATTQLSKTSDAEAPAVNDSASSQLKAPATDSEKKPPTGSTGSPTATQGNEESDHFKILVRTNEGSERLILPVEALPPISLWSKLFKCRCGASAHGSSYPAKKVILQALKNKYPDTFGTPSAQRTLSKSLVEAKKPSMPNDLLAMEERQVIRSYKFGLAYLKAGQTTEAQALANCEKDVSPAFTDFLTFLGEKIELKGWKGYRAGLDVSPSQNTGTHSIYTKWQGYEVMFHTSHLLPYLEKSTEQLERKRHIGNDLVVIVFTESDLPFDVSTVASKQIHIIAVVQPVGKDQYKMMICPRTGVPPYTPALPEPTLFTNKSVDRDFFFHKLVNAERATYKAPSFAPKIARTRNVLLQNIADSNAK